MRISLALILFHLFHVHSVPTPPPHSHLCESVRIAYSLDHAHSHSHSSPDTTPTCTSRYNRDCCTGFGSELRTRAKRDLQSALTALSTAAIVTIRESRIRIREILNETLLIANKEMETLFIDSNRVKAVMANLQLFLQLSERMSKKRVEEYIQTLFDSLFITEYEKQKRKVFSGEYLECVSHVWMDYNAFGSVPHILTKKMSQSAEYLSLSIRSLLLAQQLIENSTKLFSQLSEKCAKELVRASYCGHCVGLDLESARPCRSMCERVVSDCMGHWLQLDDLWRHLITAIQTLLEISRFEKQLKTFTSFANLLKDSLILFRNKRFETNKKVKVGCGTPKRYLRSSLTPPPSPPPLPPPTAPPFSTTLMLSKSLSTIGENLEKIKDFYSSFPKLICVDYSDAKCWNGGADADADAVEEEYSSEARDVVNTTTDDVIVSSLRERMKKMFESLDSMTGSGNKKLNFGQRMTEEYLMDSSGRSSGWSEHALTDDEDYVQTGSGSGAGQDDHHTDHTDHSNHGNHSGNHGGDSSRDIDFGDNQLTRIGQSGVATLEPLLLSLAIVVTVVVVLI